MEKLGNRSRRSRTKGCAAHGGYPTLHERLGYLYAGNGSYASAAREFEQAPAAEAPRTVAHTYRRTVTQSW